MSYKKSERERAEEAALQSVLMGDMMRRMGIANDPVACANFRADCAAGDIEKYSPSSGLGLGLEGTLTSPTVPSKQCSTQCRYCDSHEGQNGGKLRACTGCNVVRYCGRDCQKKDWKYHKPNCLLLRNNPKGDCNPRKKSDRWKLPFRTVPQHPIL
jgi:hypothetical protein